MVEKYSMYAAHVIKEKDENDEEIITKAQSIKDHCEQVAELARSFAECFGAGDAAALCGLAHDIGKYSKEFQRRIWEDGPKVDHSTAGGKELCDLKSLGFSCVAGHHSGLPDISPLVNERLRKKIPDYNEYSKEISLRKAYEPSFWTEGDMKYPQFARSFYIRMLFSCLVDADYLDTESFMSQGDVNRKSGSNIETLCEMFTSFVEKKHWLEGKDGINFRRSQILRQCIDTGSETIPGLFSLTVPTGGGKTGASLAFALNHAKKNHMKRVIYVVPYCAIIDQTVKAYNEILGEENVLAHYSEADVDEPETREEREKAELKKLATENWDMPVIVTTAVQFFESLFSNRTSKCRKLHNIADSVIVFDEAQTIPVDFLRPCVFAIAELTLHYHATCVLCTATQPSLEKYVSEYNAKLSIREICEDTDDLYEQFRRVSYENLGELSTEELAERLSNYEQVLCIVSTRAQARKIYEMLPADGRYHLSTWMTPEDRKRTLDLIKKNLDDKKNHPEAKVPCRVISTSLIEAGVDLDFPIVFRAQAGLDSIIQAGGRCNREGKRDVESSKVFIFQLQGMNRLPAAMKLPGEITGRLIRKNEGDIDSLQTIKKYFNDLYYNKGAGLDREKIVDKLAKVNGRFEFEEVGKKFKLIETHEDKNIFIIDGPESASLAEKIRVYEGLLTRDLYRKAGKYCVSVSGRVFNELRPGLEVINEDFAILAVGGNYSKETGLNVKFVGGEAIIC